MPSPSTVVRHLGRILNWPSHQPLREPLPVRWVELIHYLNDKERSSSDRPSEGQTGNSAQQH
jgi:hypothetical protein